MKTAIVTGAGGFIGGALTARLLDGGYRVYGVDVKSEYMCRFKNGRFTPVEADLSEVRLSDMVPKKVDVLYYLSWGGSLGGRDLYDVRMQMDNVTMAASVCEDAAQFVERFIFASSSYESMKNKLQPRYPFNVYGIAKRAAGDICASISIRTGMEYNKVILTNTYGVGDRSSKAVNTIIKSMLNDGPLKLVRGDRPNDWMYIDDTVSGLVAAYECGEPYETYYIGHDDISTFKDKILAMGNVLCPDRRFTFGEMPEDTYVDYDEIRRGSCDGFTFGCTADFEESIMRTAKWLETGMTSEKIRGGVIPDCLLRQKAEAA